MTQTFDDIKSKFLRDIRANIPGAKTTDGDYAVIGTAVGNLCLPIYANALWLSQQIFPDTGEKVTLQKFASTYGVPKLGDLAASGPVTVTASFATTIADGATLVNLTTGARYETVGTTSIGGTLTATAYVKAIDAGTSGNSTAGVVLTFESVPPGVNPTATVISIAGGDNAWSDDRWALEILKRMRSKPSAGNIAHIRAIVESVVGVEACFVYPALRGSGTLDVCVVVSAASSPAGGSLMRVAGPDTLAKVAAALQFGIKAPGGDFVAGIPEDVFANTVVSAAAPQSTDLLIQYKPSGAAPFAAWPPYGIGFVVPGTVATWYRTDTVVPATSVTVFRITKPLSGTVVAPAVGNLIGAFFASKGYCKATISSVIDSGLYWDVAVNGWMSSAGDSPTVVMTLGTVIVPWNPQLVNVCGAPVSPSLALTGAMGDYFASLGPGEMTALTADDTARRLRWPRMSDTNPVTGEAEFPTDITARAQAAITRATDVVDVTVQTLNSSLAVDTTKSTPAVPAPAYIGTPPSILTLGTIYLIPIK